MDRGLVGRRHEHQPDVPLGKLPVELEDRRARVGLRGRPPLRAAIGPAGHLPRVQESGTGAIVDARPIEQPPLAADIALLVATAGVDQKFLGRRQDELRQERLGLQVLLVLVDGLQEHRVASKRLRDPAAVMLAVGRRGPRQGVEDVAALRPGVFTPALGVLPHLAIRLHGRNREQREQPDHEERPLHARADFGVADFELGLLFAGLGFGSFGHCRTAIRK